MFENLSQEVLDQLKQAKTKEEALELLKQNGVELSAEDLSNVEGGEGGVTCLPFILDPGSENGCREFIHCRIDSPISAPAEKEKEINPDPFCGKIW